jgi:hypothetical protein
MNLANVDCVGCHYSNGDEPGEEFRGFTYEASDEACMKCHGPEFRGIWEETKSELQGTLEELGGKLEAVRAALEASSLPAGEREAARADVARAERWHEFVQVSRGEHNIYLASLALRREDALLGDLTGRLGSASPDLSSLPLLSGGYCATLCHARIGVQVPPEAVEVEAYGATMPHKDHADLLACVRCHEIGAHKEVPLREDVLETVCSECH